MPGTLVAPSKPSLDEARYLVKWYLYSTACYGDLFDESTLVEELSAWSTDREETQDWTSARLFLVLALGAQTCPEDKDHVAQEYYAYGRVLTVFDAMEESSAGLAAAQCYVLITLYLLNGSRLNAAYMHLGQAARAAYALGLHRSDLVSAMPALERRMRDHLWRAIRAIDIHFSATLGRPLATHEVRKSTTILRNSPTVDMCMILELVLTEAYSKSSISTKALYRILGLNRQWAAQYFPGSQSNSHGIHERVESGDSLLPDIGSCQLKQAFYGATLLLTSRYLSGSVKVRTRGVSPNLSQERAAPGAPSPQILTVACVQSAIDLIELYRELLVAEQTPKRLPLVVNSVFYAALVLGMATFGDVCTTLPLNGYLQTASKLLSMFHKHDWLARHYLQIVEHLGEACRFYIERKSRTELKSRRDLIGKLFGHVDGHLDKSPNKQSTRSSLNSSLTEQSGRSPVGGGLIDHNMASVISQSAQLEPQGSDIGSVILDALDFPSLLDASHLNSTSDQALTTPLSPFYDAIDLLKPDADFVWPSPFTGGAFQALPVDVAGR
ncbi:uncharacterized protein AB675_1416 [Cyphellophora attinorum]|uniref:Xylanolytic transcriptional activator regulatory domain-containing protein n=1 Tax=Cyphellophora attinorum TaxID=1664694 RepID=A0A0N1HK16_9EURO|nr:uncharacterized protein AB675_1416 [Phialophora attinorum]KPI34445.1 hypothetical protein AB675_1416 [Phialophora attinorum]